jgi:hypothetical protein
MSVGGDRPLRVSALAAAGPGYRSGARLAQQARICGVGIAAMAITDLIAAACEGAAKAPGKPPGRPRRRALTLCGKLLEYLRKKLISGDPLGWSRGAESAMKTWSQQHLDIALVGY